ncbi:Crp/Fnr family transcriptional regulator [Ramlibacter sp. USB13]|uniref:Crp/Fnr family transcriptional regulator n=1 Tax=Ramlibacter cellulosilyticus TaxID=2764187 RepID=A0A923MU78_9BURK|nr:Crp/Fnr family transcriptional regulator [Ramlibacter cellulosilyticus]MBC5785250.1 Crp/Fnr family transcriptional regulator [Ramlibacter cellulosilyticus]
MASSTQPSSLGLRQIDLLQGLSADRLDAIGRQCAWRPYEAGQRLVAREDADRDVHFIVGGTVLVTTYAANGRETSLRELSAGTSFGEIAAVDGRPRSADVVALTSGLLASMSPADFRELLRAEWQVNERVLQRLSQLVRLLTERVVEVSTLNVQQRVCMELLRLAGTPARAGGALRIEPAPRHAELAHRVSSYREQVTRELSALVKSGLLAKDGAALVVRDPAGLQALARGMGSRAPDAKGGA